MRREAGPISFTAVGSDDVGFSAHQPLSPGICKSACSGIEVRIIPSIVRSGNARKILGSAFPDLQNLQRERVTGSSFGLFGALGVAALLLECLTTLRCPACALAIFRWSCIPTSHGYGPICPYDPSAARIEPRDLASETATSGSARNLLRWFGVVKSTVINGEPTASRLGIDIDKALAELNIAPPVIMLRLDRRCDDRIDSSD